MKKEKNITFYKKCSRCKNLFPPTLEYFKKKTDGSDRLQSMCIECLHKKNAKLSMIMRKKVTSRKKVKRQSKIDVSNNVSNVSSIIIDSFGNRMVSIKKQMCLYANCKTLRLEHSKYCEEHWIKRRLCVLLGNGKLWKGLREIARNQNYKCAYTGKELIPGINMCIERIMPNRGLDGIKWIDCDVRRIKENLTHREFSDIVKALYRYYFSENGNKSTREID